MNIKNTIIATAIAFLFLTGTALADVRQNQSPESSSFLQTDETAEFAAYEFDHNEEISKANENARNVSNSGEDPQEWTPELWTEIP